MQATLSTRHGCPDRYGGSLSRMATPTEEVAARRHLIKLRRGWQQPSIVYRAARARLARMLCTEPVQRAFVQVRQMTRSAISTADENARSFA